MNKWFNEVCLLNQQCVWDNKKTIKSICEEIDNVVIKEFVRFECGEGSKKEETKSFADEVAATISELYYDKQYKF